MRARLGISPIAWWNDDLPELSDDVSLDECLRQARAAGFTGMETGRRFPMEAGVLGEALAPHGMAVCGGWFSGRLVDGDIAAEKARIAGQLALFKALGAPCIIYGETARSIQGERSRPLASKPRLADDEMRGYARRMTEFGDWCAGQGMPLAYHHHMGAVVETEAEIDRFMAHSGAGISLVYDAGHLAFAGGDVLGVIDRHHARIRHVHAKDVRAEVIAGLDRSRDSFLDAVVKGAFTVPGDGALDFGAIAGRLARHGYEGWFVVEAEQDPRAAPPAEYARIGRAALAAALAGAGYVIA